jgi:hypothetical protein
MNRIILLLLIALLFFVNPVFGFTVPNIAIYTSYAETGGRTGGKELQDQMAEQVKAGVKKEFPCASILTLKDLKALLETERVRELLGEYFLNPSGNEINDKEFQSILDKTQERNRQPFLDAVGCRYYIILRILAIGKTTTINLLFKDRQNQKNDLGFFCESNCGDVNSGPFKSMIDQLVKELAYHEICPYKGSVNIAVNSELKKQSTSEHPVFCNNADGVFKQSSLVDNETDQQWKLKRIGKPDTNGEMTATIRERKEERIEDACHACSSGSRQGGRIYNKSTTVSASVDGLATRTKIMGEKENHSAAISLSFARNGTFMINISGSSEAANYKGTIIETAQGTCDSIDKTVKLTENQIFEKIKFNRSVPLLANCGPFPGTPYDKKLSGKKTFRLKELTGEETTISIDFDLERK